MKLSTASRLVVLFVLAMLSGCAIEQRHAPPQIRFPDPKPRVVAVREVYHDGNLVATLRTFEDAKNGQRWTSLTDDLDRTVGTIRDGVALRRTAHAGEVPVAATDDEQIVVTALLGLGSETRLTFRDLEPPTPDEGAMPREDDAPR